MPLGTVLVHDALRLISFPEMVILRKVLKVKVAGHLSAIMTGHHHSISVFMQLSEA